MARLGSNDSLLAVAVYSHAHHWCHYSIVRWCLECKLFVRGFLVLSFKRSIATSTFAMSQVQKMHIVRPWQHHGNALSLQDPARSNGLDQNASVFYWGRNAVPQKSLPRSSCGAEVFSLISQNFAGKRLHFSFSSKCVKLSASKKNTRGSESTSRQFFFFFFFELSETFLKLRLHTSSVNGRKGLTL